MGDDIMIAGNGLKQRLDSLDALVKNGMPDDKPMDKGKIADEKRKYVRNFFAADQYAERVGMENDSYSGLVDIIEKKYKGFWAKLGFIKEDKEFNQKIVMGITSLNNVGLYADNIDEFTTTYRKKSVLRTSKFTLLLFGGSLVATGLALTHTDSSMSNDLAFYSLGLSGVCLLLAGGYAIYGFKNNMDPLKKAALKTDQYVRDLYREY